MFVLADRRRYRWPVVVLVPSSTTPGEFEEQRFVALFLAPARDEALAELTAIGEMAPREADTAALETLLSKVIGWEDVVDATGSPIPFAPETLRAAAQEPWFRFAIDAAYRASMTGEAARLGN